MTDPAPVAPAATLGDLSGRLADDLLKLDGELSEVDQLITQARSEATRHEGRRAAAAEKVEALPEGDQKERLEQTASLLTLTKRAALMETQVDVLEGKRRALARYRDGLVAYLAAMGALDPSMVMPTGVSPADVVLDVADGEDAPMPAAVSRLVLRAQEDLRREIARAMHDGPAQSLTNIVLQAQIVERLVARDPTSAAGEVRQLVAMVQHTLDATKSFIFDVRPMVLDDLGLVPTLRRATRERGRRAGIPVEFESMGQDRRIPMDLESGLFRMLDEALAGYLGAAPDHVTLRLDWAEQLEARIGATRAIADAKRVSNIDIPAPEAGKDLPPALAEMFEQRLADERQAAENAIRDSIVALPAGNWREIQSRASSIGVTAELSADGDELRLVADIPALETPSED
ncbi:MAG TPA: histidine kinase [Candidatus Binatia bacterium]|nr:histidine kinase [Candidatus Binatia bacterium]